MSEHEALTLGTLEQIRNDLHELLRHFDRHVYSRGTSQTAIVADVRSQVLLDSNHYRHMATVFNDSSATLYLTLGGISNPNSFTVRLAAGDYYETPAGYIGPISGVWSAANGQARLTELV